MNWRPIVTLATDKDTQEIIAMVSELAKLQFAIFYHAIKCDDPRRIAKLLRNFDPDLASRLLSTIEEMDL